MRTPVAMRVGVLRALALLLASCGDDPAPTATVPAWAKVAPEQIAEAEMHGVPVAFENDLGLRFVLIPAGTFLMGSPEDEEGRYENEVQHEVTIPRPFYMSITEVANVQYRRFRPCPEAEAHLHGDAKPVVNVSYDLAVEFADWLSGVEGNREYRLPNEAEWEYACRAGTTTRYWAGDDEEYVARVAWYWRNSGDRCLPRTTEWDPERIRREWACSTRPCAETPANPWGLHDMHGNACELCSTAHRVPYEPPEYPGETIYFDQGPRGMKRGGAWSWCAEGLRSACRYWDDGCFVGMFGWQGIRLVSPLPPPGERGR